MTAIKDSLPEMFGPSVCSCACVWAVGCEYTDVILSETYNLYKQHLYVHMMPSQIKFHQMIKMLNGRSHQIQMSSRLQPLA